MFWLLKSLRYASMCSLQSAGEAQSGAVGYQNDTRHIRPGTGRREWSTRFKATNSRYWTSVSRYAGRVKRVHTTPPGHKTVWTHVEVHSISIAFIVPDDRIIILYHNITLYFADTWQKWKIQWILQCVDYSCFSYLRCVWTHSPL
jgi:hypothetical protein